MVDALAHHPSYSAYVCIACSNFDLLENKFMWHYICCWCVDFVSGRDFDSYEMIFAQEKQQLVRRISQFTDTCLKFELPWDVLKKWKVNWDPTRISIPDQEGTELILIRPSDLSQRAWIEFVPFYFFSFKHKKIRTDCRESLSFCSNKKLSVEILLESHAAKWDQAH